jgi:mRNA interferase YafQ
VLSIRRLSQFRRDYKRVEKQGKAMQAIDKIIVVLATKQLTEKRFKDHKLSGIYKDCRECHINPDWLLIYQITKSELVLIRTGSHAELFK